MRFFEQALSPGANRTPVDAVRADAAGFSCRRNAALALTWRLVAWRQAQGERSIEKSRFNLLLAYANR